MGERERGREKEKEEERGEKSPAGTRRRPRRSPGSGTRWRGVGGSRRTTLSPSGGTPVRSLRPPAGAGGPAPRRSRCLGAIQPSRRRRGASPPLARPGVQAPPALPSVPGPRLSGPFSTGPVVPQRPLPRPVAVGVRGYVAQRDAMAGPVPQRPPLASQPAVTLLRARCHLLKGLQCRSEGSGWLHKCCSY